MNKRINKISAMAPLIAAAFAGTGCGNAAPGGTRPEQGPLPAEIAERFTNMEGPLGCAPTESLTPDPPDGCEGAKALVAKAKSEYLLAEGATTDLGALLTGYEERFGAAHPFVEHRIERDGFTVSAREFGAEHAGEGPTVVLMHGFPDNQHLYDYVAPALGDTHRTITFDFVGWGHSTHPAAGYPYTMENLRADLDAVADYFHIDRMVPVVHDASGWPGIDWALDNEGRVSALVLLNTVYHAVPGLAPPYVIRALSAADLRQQFIDALGPGDDMNRALFRAQVGSFFTNDAARAEMLPVLEAALPRDALIGLTAEVRDGSIARVKNVPRMQAFEKPVIVAFGSDDRMLNTTVAETFASIFPHSTLEPVEGAAHYVQLDRADKVVEIVRAAATSL